MDLEKTILTGILSHMHIGKENRITSTNINTNWLYNFGLNIFSFMTEHDKGLGRAQKLCLALFDTILFK